MKKFFVILLVLLALGFAAFRLYQNISSTNTKSSFSMLNVFNQPSPTPFPFQELTIPYLRNREYQSTLGEITPTYQNSEYTAYITSYDSDGLKINGLLTIPKGNQSVQHPAIVFVHGYIPPAQYQTQQQYYDYIDYLARNGFIVFKIDLRGHGQSEGEPGGAYFSSDYIVDVLNARSALQNASFVDKNAVGLWGHSMAGNVVMRATAAMPEIPATVVWAGAVYTYADMQELGINDGSYQPPVNASQRQQRRQLLRDTYGDYSPDSSFWKQVAVTDYLKDLKGAVQVNHAVNDDVVSIEYSRGLMRLLSQTSVPHELKEYQSGGHNISGPTFNEAMQNTVHFFKSHLN